MNYNKNENKKFIDKKALYEKSAKFNNDIINCNNNYSFYYYYYPFSNKKNIKKIIPSYFHVKKPNKNINNKSKIKKVKATTNNNKKISCLNKEDIELSNSTKLPNCNISMDQRNNDDLMINIKKEKTYLNDISNNNDNNNCLSKSSILNELPNNKKSFGNFHCLNKKLYTIEKENNYQNNIHSILYYLYIDDLLSKNNLSNSYFEQTNSIPTSMNRNDKLHFTENNLMLFKNIIKNNNLLSRHYQKFNMSINNLNNNNLINFNYNKKNENSNFQKNNEQTINDDNSYDINNSNNKTNYNINNINNNILYCNTTTTTNTCSQNNIIQSIKFLIF